jgi:hypothetical protein
MGAALDFLNGPGIAGLEAPALGEVLRLASGLSGKFAAFRASALARFAAAGAHDEDGYGSPATWLTATGKMTRKEANAQVKRMRQLRDHPELHKALADEVVSESWAAEIAAMTGKLPPEVRDDIDKLLVSTAQAVTDLADLAMLARAAYEAWRRSQGPDPDDDPGDGTDPEDDGGFGERYLRLGTTLDGAGRLGGDLTPECAESVQAVLDALGKKAGPEDDRTEGQRFHDALQLACQLLLRANMVPDRKGADTRAEAVVSLSQLRDLPGASAIEEAWLAGMAGEHGYLTGKDAEVITCDAMIVPVVTGHPDLSTVDQMIALVLAYLSDDAACLDSDDFPGHGRPTPGQGRSEGLSPKHCPRRRCGRCGTPSPGSRSTWSPGPVASHPSCGTAFSTPRTTASPSSWTSVSATRSPRRSGGRWTCGPRACANGRDAAAAAPGAMCTTSSTRRTAARPPYRIAPACVSIITTCASTGMAGGSSCTRTPLPALTARKGRSCTATGHRPARIRPAD